MSIVRSIIVDGKRHDITNTPEYREYRCDGCGEYVSDPIKMEVKVFPPLGEITHIAVQLHEECARTGAPVILKVLRAAPDQPGNYPV